MSLPIPVLLIEDDPNLAEILAAGLQPDGIALAHVQTGVEALSRISQGKFDLILLDLGLPQMGGFEVLRHLKDSPAARETPVIVLTAWNGTEDKLRSFELGAVDYVTKPFVLAELRARVRSTLKAKHLQDDLRDANRELDAARVAAEEAARTKAEFLANMSHEI